eukprot:TRINITY_DN2556_c0_g1_i1.p1 TRINITY_DN2556_c0_g1~~TRINITY_DN2556_c0_g1_i1.p1  ORF type:complete len:113 (+),score=14.98 TRINITY_DN2556_c0_g1_i1:309-647(+)
MNQRSYSNKLVLALNQPNRSPNYQLYRSSTIRPTVNSKNSRFKKKNSKRKAKAPTKWSNLEKSLFEKALKTTDDPREMAKIIVTRSVTQIRAHLRWYRLEKARNRRLSNSTF